MINHLHDLVDDLFVRVIKSSNSLSQVLAPMSIGSGLAFAQRGTRTQPGVSTPGERIPPSDAPCKGARISVKIT